MNSIHAAKFEPVAEVDKDEEDSPAEIRMNLDHPLVGRYERPGPWNQKPTIIWFTGLSGAGKTTTAMLLKEKLSSMGCSTYLLDGDIIRQGLCKDLGFSDQDRMENIRRVGEVAKLMIKTGLIVLVSFISPYRKDREMVRAMVEQDEFVECFINASLATCEQRDAKGLYKKAREGKLKNFTGIDSPYEKPVNPELNLNTELYSPKELIEQIIEHLDATSIIY